MKRCTIKFPRECVRGSIGTKEEINAFLSSLHGQYDYEGLQSVRDREKHRWLYVKVYSYADYFFGTQFVCYPIIN